ncbi:MAG TPA: winged helix-turn-helix domain-containing protein [Micromonosporaceae bacterium]|nr:winged helix-turn-helix domain-containing protein [Micromonosporaceae bacterium]
MEVARPVASACSAPGRPVADPGVSPLARRALVNWCRRHAKNGDAAVAAGRRLIRPGEPTPLTRAQQLDLADTLRDSHPDDHGLPGHLWSRQSLAAIILSRYGVRLTVRGVNRQLKAWGLGPRTPAERACGLCVGAVVTWLTGAYPGIVRMARAAGGQVCWAGRGRLVGLSPAVEVVTAVTSRGGLRFEVATGRAEAPLPGSFLSRLAAHEGREVHVIMDGSFTAADWPRHRPAGVVLHPMPCCARADRE